MSAEHKNCVDKSPFIASAVQIDRERPPLSVTFDDRYIGSEHFGFLPSSEGRQHDDLDVQR